MKMDRIDWLEEQVIFLAKRVRGLERAVREINPEAVENLENRWAITAPKNLDESAVPWLIQKGVD